MRNLRHTISHTVCHTAGHTATGGPERSRSHDGFPIGKARDACGIGDAFVLCFCSYFRSFLLACFGCCRAFLALISRPSSSIFQRFGDGFWRASVWNCDTIPWSSSADRMTYKSGSRVVQKVIQTACKSRPNGVRKSSKCGPKVSQKSSNSCAEVVKLTTVTWNCYLTQYI